MIPIRSLAFEFLRTIFFGYYNLFDLARIEGNELHVFLSYESRRKDSKGHALVSSYCPRCFFGDMAIGQFKESIEATIKCHNVEKVVIHCWEREVVEVSEEQLANPEFTWRCLGPYDGCRYVPQFRGIAWAFDES